MVYKNTSWAQDWKRVWWQRCKTVVSRPKRTIPEDGCLATSTLEHEEILWALRWAWWKSATERSTFAVVAQSATVEQGAEWWSYAIEVELALEDMGKPIGVADYQLIVPKEKLQKVLTDEIKAFSEEKEKKINWASKCQKQIIERQPIHLAVALGVLNKSNKRYL